VAIAGIFGMSEAGPAFGGGRGQRVLDVTAVVIGIALLAAVLLRRIDWI
jgi:hypothetical protein